jgi:hypothetical protein
MGAAIALSRQAVPNLESRKTVVHSCPCRRAPTVTRDLAPVQSRLGNGTNARFSGTYGPRAMRLRESTGRPAPATQPHGLCCCLMQLPATRCGSPGYANPPTSDADEKCAGPPGRQRASSGNRVRWSPPRAAEPAMGSRIEALGSTAGPSDHRPGILGLLCALPRRYAPPSYLSLSLECRTVDDTALRHRTFARRRQHGPRPDRQ